MRFSDWYTDTMDVYRVVPTTSENLTKEGRVLIGSQIRCRVYSTQLRGAIPQATAAVDRKEDRLACAVDTDIRIGDELIVTRGARVGGAVAERYLAGQPQRYYDPVGRRATGLDHMEVGLLADNIAEA